MKAIYKAIVGTLIVSSLLLFVLVMLGVLQRMREEGDESGIVEHRAAGVRCFSLRGQLSCIQNPDSDADTAPAGDVIRQPQRSTT
jgi:hypothetical protein